MTSWPRRLYNMLLYPFTRDVWTWHAMQEIADLYGDTVSVVEAKRGVRKCVG